MELWITSTSISPPWFLFVNLILYSVRPRHAFIRQLIIANNSNSSFAVCCGVLDYHQSALVPD